MNLNFFINNFIKELLCLIGRLMCCIFKKVPLEKINSRKTFKLSLVLRNVGSLFRIIKLKFMYKSS